MIATGGVLHYLWLVKADMRGPIIYGLILVALLGYRAWITRAALPATPPGRQPAATDA